MLALPDLPLRLPGLAVVQPDLFVRAHAHQHRAVGAKRHAVDETIVLALEHGVELEWRAVVENQARIVAARGGAERPLLPQRHGIDGRLVAGDLADAVAAVPGEAVAEALLAVADRDEALPVAVPREVVHAPHDLELALGGTLADAVPHPHRARRVAARHVVARGREARDRRGRRVLRVLRAARRLVDGPQENGLGVGVGEALALGVGGERGWPPPLRCGSGRPDRGCGKCQSVAMKG